MQNTENLQCPSRRVLKNVNNIKAVLKIKIMQIPRIFDV